MTHDMQARIAVALVLIASLVSCSNGAEHLVLEPVYVGFDAPRVFLVGYGLDHAENFRHLPYIASLT